MTAAITVTFLLVVFGFFAMMILSAGREGRERRKPPNPEVICPHCGVKGQVRVMRLSKTASWGKHAGVEMVTEMSCLNCKVTWEA